MDVFSIKAQSISSASQSLDSGPDPEGIQSGPPPFRISRALIIFPTLINAC